MFMDGDMVGNRKEEILLMIRIYNVCEANDIFVILLFHFVLQYTYAPAAQLISLDGYADGNTHTQV